MDPDVRQDDGWESVPPASGSALSLLIRPPDAAAIEILRDELPVDEIGKQRVDEGGPLVAIVDIISMLPHIDGEQGLHPLMRHRCVAVVKRGDPERVAVENEPRPAAGEMADR